MIPRRSAESSATKCGEVATDDKFSIWLQRQREHGGAVRAWIETGIEGAIGVEPPDMTACGRARSATETVEVAADENSPIRLYR